LGLIDSFKLPTRFPVDPFFKTSEAAIITIKVVTSSSASGYLGHTAKGEMNWELTVIVVLAVIIGSQLGGQYMTQKAKSKQVKVAYAVVLLLISFKMIHEVIA